MSDFTTELMHALQKDFPLDEFFRQQLESAVNGLLQSEITAFLGYEKPSFGRLELREQSKRFLCAYTHHFLISPKRPMGKYASSIPPPLPSGTPLFMQMPLT